MTKTDKQHGDEYNDVNHLNDVVYICYMNIRYTPYDCSSCFHGGGG